ncbi:MAG: hypothetical protein HQL96_15175 [Magnetococcales bacterium]|nr:hypothetical protein [Magnetococcales bacterium]
MNITDAKRGFLFCEGQPDSLDFALLNRLALPAGVMLIPLRGKGSAERFIEGYFAGYGDGRPRPPHLLFRDRDFDFRPSERIELLKPNANKPIYLSYRSCIENYLLDATLLDEFWQYGFDKQWQFGPSPGNEELEKWILEAARAITEYQATRWALSSLAPEEGWSGLANRWMRDMPLVLDEPECLRQARKLITIWNNKIEFVIQEQFETCYHDWLGKFRQCGFWDKREYQIYFSGKEMAVMMERNSPYTPCFPLSSFFKWAVEKLNWASHADLLGLQNKLSELRVKTP